jgi:hypothetical protein
MARSPYAIVTPKRSAPAGQVRVKTRQATPSDRRKTLPSWERRSKPELRSKRAIPKRSAAQRGRKSRDTNRLSLRVP